MIDLSGASDLMRGALDEMAQAAASGILSPKLCAATVLALLENGPLLDWIAATEMRRPKKTRMN